MGMRALDNVMQEKAKRLEKGDRRVPRAGSTSSQVQVDSQRRLESIAAVVSFYPIPKNFPGSFVLAADGRRVSLPEWVTQALKKQDLPTKGRKTIHNAKTDGILVD
jgi:hypothetical protein